MSGEKKTEVITIRISKDTKNKLQDAADQREWTISKLAEKLLSTWVNEKDKS